MATQKTRATGDGSPPGADPVRTAQDRFISTWGQMAGAWGISRTMAEIHALLYITGEALNSDDVIDRLQISRGNASMSLRALQEWGLIRRVHRRGDRKEYFECESDVWSMFKTIARERKKRELDPVLASLYEIRDLTGVKEGDSAGRGRAGAEGHNKRMDEMLEFLETVEKLADRMVNTEGAGLKIVRALIKTMS